jgi:hypothetical protein
VSQWPPTEPRTMKKLFATLTLLALCTGAAFAQNMPDATAPAEPTRTTVGPSTSVTKTQQSIDGRGVEMSSTETYDKSQSFTSGNGVLSAKTSTKTTGDSEVKVPPKVTTTRSTTTTEETSR